MSVVTRPCTTVGRDRDGLPDRITIPGGARRRVVLVVGGETVGWVEPSGNVLAGAVETLDPSSRAASMLNLMKHGTGQFQAVFNDGQLVAVVATRR